MTATENRQICGASVPYLSGGAEQYRLGGKAAAIVVMFGASLLLLNLDGGTRTLTYHEVLFAQPAKEMLATGNWVLPKFAGVPCTHKPPGANWVIAGLMWLTGSEAEALVRIPSALAGVLTALILAGLAARWFGRRVGLVAGLMQLTTYYVLQLARLAECDMLMIAAVTGAMACFALDHVDSPRGRVEARWVPWAFYACAAAAYLFKGLIGPAFIFSGCAGYLLWSQDLRGLKFFFNPIGLAIFWVGTAGWFAAAYTQYPPILDDQIMHHFGRFQGEMGGGKNSFYYLYSLLLILMPWAPLIVAGGIYGLRQGLHAQPFWRFTICWAVPGLVLLGLSSFKSKHYPAPLMPPLTIVGALALLGYLRLLHRCRARTHAMLAVATLAGCLAGAAAVRWLVHRPAEERNVMAVLVLVAAAGLLASIYFNSRCNLAGSLAATFAMAWIAVGGVFAYVMPHHDSYRGQTELAGRVNQAVPPGRDVYLLRLPANGENQIAYYLQRPMKRVDALDEFGRALPEKSDEIYVLAPELAQAELKRHGHVEILDNRFPGRRKELPGERMMLFKLHRTQTAGRTKPVQ